MRKIHWVLSGGTKKSKQWEKRRDREDNSRSYYLVQTIFIKDT